MDERVGDGDRQEITGVAIASPGVLGQERKIGGDDGKGGGRQVGVGKEKVGERGDADAGWIDIGGED